LLEGRWRIMGRILAVALSKINAQLGRTSLIFSRTLSILSPSQWHHQPP
jgi:hypothetical protein